MNAELTQLETEYKEDHEQVKSKVESNSIDNSDLENLRIIEEAEKFYQQTMSNNI